MNEYLNSDYESTDSEYGESQQDLEMNPGMNLVGSYYPLRDRVPMPKDLERTVMSKLHKHKKPYASDVRPPPKICRNGMKAAVKTSNFNIEQECFSAPYTPSSHSKHDNNHAPRSNSLHRGGDNDAIARPDVFQRDGSSDPNLDIEDKLPPSYDLDLTGLPFLSDDEDEEYELAEIDNENYFQDDNNSSPGKRKRTNDEEASNIYSPPKKKRKVEFKWTSIFPVGFSRLDSTPILRFLRGDLPNFEFRVVREKNGEIKEKKREREPNYPNSKWVYNQGKNGCYRNEGHIHKFGAVIASFLYQFRILYNCNKWVIFKDEMIKFKNRMIEKREEIEFQFNLKSTDETDGNLNGKTKIDVFVECVDILVEMRFSKDQQNGSVLTSTALQFAERHELQDLSTLFLELGNEIGLNTKKVKVFNVEKAKVFLGRQRNIKILKDQFGKVFQNWGVGEEKEVVIEIILRFFLCFRKVDKKKVDKKDPTDKDKKTILELIRFLEMKVF